MADEYIKRSDALKQFESIDWYHVNRNGKLVSGATSHDDPFVRYDAVEEVLKALPAAADVAPVRHGRNESETGFMCSVCAFRDFGVFRGYKPSFCPNCGAKMDGGNIITGDATIPTISNTEYIDTGINASICNEWKTLQDDEEMLRAVGANGESVTIDRKNKTLTCTDEYGRTVTMNPLKIIKDGEIVWARMDGGEA